MSGFGASPFGRAPFGTGVLPPHVGVTAARVPRSAPEAARVAPARIRATRTTGGAP